MNYPLDCTGHPIREGDTLVISTGRGVRVGIVIGTRDHYTVTVERIIPIRGRQTFSIASMGQFKFWVVRPVELDTLPGV